MKVSSAGLKFIANEEGEVLHVYADQVGVKTIGIGHALHPGESFPNGITHEQALMLLQQDVATAENAINSDVKVTITQNMCDSLASFTYNLGTGALASSTLLKLLNQGNYTGAADEFLKWCHAPANVVNPGILARRKRERQLFLTPDAAPAAPPTPVPAAPVPVTPVPVTQPAAPTVPSPVSVPSPTQPATSFQAVIDFFAMVFRLLTGGK
jgi:lysozyme